MKWLAIFFSFFIVAIIVLADLGRLGLLSVINQIPFGDKAGHFILYGILTLLIDLTVLRSFRNPAPKDLSKNNLNTCDKLLPRTNRDKHNGEEIETKAS